MASHGGLRRARGYEPGHIRRCAMTISALLLRHRFYNLQPRESLKYGTEAFVADPDGYTWALLSPPKVAARR